MGLVLPLHVARTTTMARRLYPGAHHFFARTASLPSSPHLDLCYSIRAHLIYVLGIQRRAPHVASFQWFRLRPAGQFLLTTPVSSDVKSDPTRVTIRLQLYSWDVQFPCWMLYTPHVSSPGPHNRPSSNPDYARLFVLG